MHILGRGTIFDARTAPSEARFCTFPSLACTESGRLIVSFRTGSAKDSADEDCRVMASDDRGATWQTIFTGFGDVPPGRGRIRCLGITAACRGRLIGSLGWVDRSDPTLPLFNPQTEGILPTKVLFVESRDSGRFWPAPREVALLPHTGNAVTGAILSLKNGALALPYEAWKEYGDPDPARHHASLRISADGGATWPELGIVAHDPAGRLLYWDQRLSVDPETGELIAMFWTHDREAGRDLDIHSAAGSPDGRRWSQPASTGIAGQICAPLALDGGRVFAAYVHRHHPPSLRAILSDDCGRTWTAADELVFYEKKAGGESGMHGQRDFADYWADMSIWTFGHPAPLLLPDGDIMVAYYAGDETAMGIHWVRIGLDVPLAES
ncbi:MAG: sialidase family protein [Chloroflexi bacterium]|nr:sialidase family protein [Chloroflexota bacterium]